MWKSTTTSRGAPLWQIGAALVTLGAILTVGIYLGRNDRIVRVDYAALAHNSKTSATVPAVDRPSTRAATPPGREDGILNQRRRPVSPPQPAVKSGPSSLEQQITAKAYSARAQSDLQTLIGCVKRATVYLRVVSSDDRVWEGTGFFAAEPGVVLTNAHVLGMGRPGMSAPKHIDAVVHSGSHDERTCRGRILAVDPLTDLAVLRIDGVDLPAPLSVHSAARLRELERLYIFGFPFGQSLGKQITVSESSVSSLRLDETGKLNRVQVNGGMHPGNSGGPVVDARGDVIGVAVSGIHGTQINFAVPGDFIHALLGGRLAGHVVGMPYRDGNSVRVPYEMVFLDPLERIRQPHVEYWCGGPRMPGQKDAPGAAKTQKLALEYENGRARGELRLPQAEPGKTLWLRAGFVSGEGEPRLAHDQGHPLMPPLVRKTVRLQLARSSGRHHLHLLSTARLHLASEGAAKSLGTHLDVQMVEKIQPLTKDSLVQIEYGAPRVVIAANGKPAPDNPRLREIADQFPVLVCELYQDSLGSLRPYRLNRTRVPPALRDDVSEVHEQVLNALLAVNVTLPNREVKARESWKSLLALPGPLEAKSDMAIAELACTYEGILTRNGRSEALITMSGDIRAASAPQKTYRGRAEGQAMLDLASGQFVDIAVTMFLDMEPTMVEGRSVHTSGSLEVRLHREPNAKTH